MHIACNYAPCMKHVQVRNVPDKTHRTLKARAAMAGMSLSEYLLAELKRIAETPTRRELLHRIAQRPPPRQPLDAAAIVREERDSC